MVERLAVNQWVVGSSPTSGAVNQSEARFTAVYRVCEANSGT